MADVVVVPSNIELSFALGFPVFAFPDPLSISFTVQAATVKTTRAKANANLTFSVDVSVVRIRKTGAVNFTLTFCPNVAMAAALPPAPSDDPECPLWETTPFVDCDAPATFGAPEIKTGCECP